MYIKYNTLTLYCLSSRVVKHFAKAPCFTPLGSRDSLQNWGDLTCDPRLASLHPSAGAPGFSLLGSRNFDM